MYRVLVDNFPLHDPRMSKEYLLESATLVEQLNTQGSFDFTCPQTNKYWDMLKPRTCSIDIELNGEIRWSGRIIGIERGWENKKICHCEGELAKLMDGIIEPFSFKGTPEAFLEFLTDKHDAEFANDPTHIFSVGDVTVEDPNETIIRGSESAMTTWAAISEKCFESSLGGYLTLSSGHTLNWLKDFVDGNGDPLVATQKVKFSQNLIDLAIETNASELITCVFPYGAQFEESQGSPPYEEKPSGEIGHRDWDGNRLTIASVMPNGEKYLVNQQAVAKWGKIYGTYTWDEITIASNLKDAAQAWLDEQCAKAITAIEATAADLSLLDSDLDEIMPGLYVAVESAPHILNELLLCTAKTTDIIDPSQTTVTLGVGPRPLTSMIGG